MSDWEDVAMGPPSTTNTGDWEDVAYGDKPDRGALSSIYHYLAGENAVPPSSIGQAFSNAASNLTSADWWLTPPDAPKLSVAETVAGPFLAANNAVNPFGDETVAGANTVIDTFAGNPTTYQQRLAQARDLEADFDQRSPLVSGVIDVAGAFKLPTKFGTAAEPAKALARIGQAAKEGAGWGAAFGFGSGDSLEERLEGGGVGALLGGGLGTAISGGAETVRKALSLGDYLPGLSKLLTSTPEQEAGQILKNAAGGKIAQIAPDAANPLSKYRTLAEITQSPELAQLEQTLGKAEGPANSILSANLNARQKAQKAALETLSSQPQLTNERGGDVLRELIEPRAAKAKEGVEELFDSISPKNKVVINPIRNSFNKDMRTTYLAGGEPKALSSIQKEMSVLIDEKGKDVAFVPYPYIKSLRARAQNAWVKARDVGDDQAKRVANNLVRSIDKAIDQSAAVKLFKKSDAETYKLAKKTASDYFDTYGAKGAGNVIAKLKEGQYVSKASNVVQNTFDGTAEGTRKILRAIGEAPEELDKARGVVRDYLFKLGSDNDGNISAGKFRTILRKYKEGINAKLPNGKALFEKNHLKTIDYLAEELAFVDTQSAKSVKQLAYTASIGQPTTAQALMSKNVASKFLGPLVTKFDDWFGASRQEQVNALLSSAITSPKNAKLLISRAQSTGDKGGLYKLLTSVARPIKALPSASPFLGRGAGSLGSAITEKSSTPIEERPTSFNSKLDSVVNQQIDKAMKAPKIVSIKGVGRTSREVSSESFLEKEEGGQRLKAYNPPAKGSGITVSTGVDLGQWSKEDLESAGVSSKTTNKLRKYLGLKDATARAFLKENPLELTKAEADELDSAVKSDIFGTVEAKLKSKGVTLAKLPDEAQTVIKSISYNFGKNFDESLPSIWKAIVNKDWGKVQSLLINTKWKQPELKDRRLREARLLDKLVRT